MEIALLARVSSQRQEKEDTVETQLDYGRNWARLNGHNIPEGCVYTDEGVSGLTDLTDRPEGRRLLEDAAAGRFQAVAFYRLDRLGRNILVIYTAIDLLEQLGIGVMSMTENFNSQEPFGRLMIGFLALLATWERESLLMRCRDGRERVAREGKWAGGRERYGYKAENGRLQVQPEAASVVMEIFRLYARDGLALQKLADYLMERGIPNPAHTRGETSKVQKKTGRVLQLTSRWYPGTLRAILTDPIYKGATSWEGVPQIVEPIVPEDLWERAQQRLRTNRQFKQCQAEDCRSYLLRGLVYCTCGRSAQGTTWRSGKRLPANRHLYVCRNGLTTSKRRDGERCRMPPLASAVEAEILADCQRFLETPGLLTRLLSEQQGGATEQRERLRGELYATQSARAALQEERERLRRALRKGSITEEEWEADAREIEQEREELTERIERLSERVQSLDAEQEQLEDAENLLRRMREGNLSPREMVLGLVRRVTIVRGTDGKGKAEVEYWPKEPAQESAAYCSSTGTICDTFRLRRAYCGVG
jgi:site-specific DNA recombinase